LHISYPSSAKHSGNEGLIYKFTAKRKIDFYKEIYTCIAKHDKAYKILPFPKIIEEIDFMSDAPANLNTSTL